MQPASTFLDAFGRVRDSLHRQLADLSVEELTREPHPPIGWLAWRLTRIQDSNFSRLAGLDQLWLANGWHARFGMPPEPADFGRGVTHTRAMIAAFDPHSPQLILDYHDATFERTKTYLTQLTPEEADRELDEPQYTPLPTVAVRIVSVLENSVKNTGQIEYLKLYHRIGGWYPVEVAPPR